MQKYPLPNEGSSVSGEGFRRVNVRDVDELAWENECRRGFGKQLSQALGRIPKSTDAMLRHPFDVELLRVPAGATPYRFHSHSAQWEFYYVVSGTGVVRTDSGRHGVEPGDAFLFKPGEAHAMTAGDGADLLVLVVADNPLGESYHYPDEAMWTVTSPEKAYVERRADGS